MRDNQIWKILKKNYLKIYIAINNSTYRNSTKNSFCMVYSRNIRNYISNGKKSNQIASRPGDFQLLQFPSG